MENQKQPEKKQKQPMPKTKKELISSIIVLVCAVIIIICGAIMIPKSDRTTSIIGIVMTCCGAAMLGFGIFDVIKNSKKWELEKEAH